MYRLVLLFLVLSFWVVASTKITVVDNSSPIDIRLDKKLFFSDTKYTTKPLIKCNPRLSDVLFRVNSEQSISIIPKKIFPSSKLFRCQTSKGNYRFSFNTKPFKLKDIQIFPKQRLLRVIFNDTISKEQLNQALKVLKRSGLSKTQLQYKIVSHKDNIFLVEILEPIGSDGLEVVIDKNLQSQSGATLSQNITKTLSLQSSKIVELNPKVKEMIIYDKPQMVSRNGGYVLRLYFDDSFDNLSEVKPFVHIDGISNFKVGNMEYMSDLQKKDENISNDSLVSIDITSDEFKPNRSYKVTLKKGLTNYHQLKRDITFKVKTKDLPSFIFFPKKRVYLSSLGDIGFESINVSQATLRVEKITPLNYRYFIVYDRRDIEKVKKFTKEIFSKELTLNNPKNEKIKHKFHISDLAKEGSGVYKIILDYKINFEGKEYDEEASKIVFVSDIGINAKLSQEQLFVSLFSLKSSEPIKEAKVELLSEKNIILATATTSLDGTAKIELKNLLSKKPTALIVSTKDDKNFLLFDKPINKTSIAKISKKKRKYRAYIYFQSDIVRPAVDIQSLIILKDKNLKSAPNLPLKVKLIRADDFRTTFKKSFTTNKNGLIDIKIPVPYYERTGAYFLKVYLGDSEIGKKRVDVESFMPPQIKNSIKAPSACLGGEFLDVEVSSSYLFGAPASNLSGTVSIRGVEGEYKSAKFSDYNFSSPTDKKRDYLLIDESLNIILDDRGRASLKLPCKIDKNSKVSVVKATVGATIMDGNQPVSSYKSIKIYPYSRVVGIKLSSSILSKGDTLEGWVVLVDPKSEKRIDSSLVAKLYRLNWLYSYVDGNYKWDIQKELVDSFRVSTKQRFEYPNLQEGDYELEIIDPLTGASTSQKFEVSGWGYSSPSYGTTPKKVGIKFENREYKRGDNLKVSIKSPIIDGKLLLSIERDGVLWHNLYSIKKGSASVDIPIDVELGRGAYLGALVVRKTDTNSSIIPFRAFGFKAIKSNQRDKEIKLSLDFNKSTKSNSKVELTVTTDREADILVSVVDEGILNITNQTPPNPFKFFTPTPDLGVVMFDIYDDVMGYIAEGKLISFGAGDEEDISSRKRHLPPPDVQRVKPFMLWSGILHTQDKKAKFTIDVPPFNGKARVSVLATNSDGVGAKSDDLIVKDDIIIKTSAPRFLLRGDRLKLPLRVINTTDKEMKIKLKIDSSKNIKTSLNHLNLTLKPKSQKEMIFDVEATDSGKAFLRFSAKEYKREIELPIYSPYTLQEDIKRGVLQTPKTKTITIPAKFLGGDSYITLSDNILGSLNSELKYLVSYPYGCAEQTASRVGALIWAEGFIKDKHLAKKSKLFIREGVRKLLRLLNFDGEFRYWSSGDFVEPYSSVYASDIMLETNSSLISPENRRLILRGLKSISSLDHSGLVGSYSNLLECYSAYLLAREKAIAPNTLNMLYEKGVCKSDEVAMLFLASAFKETKNDSLAQEIFKSSRVSIEELAKSRAYGYPFGGWKWRLFTTGYLKAKYFGLSDREFNLIQLSFNSLYSTQDKALAIRVSRAYLGDRVSPKPIKAVVKFDSQAKSFDSPKTIKETLHSPEIKIEAKEGAVSYLIDSYKYLPKEAKNRLDLNADFGVSREFLSRDGSRVELDNLGLKDELYARVTIMNRPKVDSLLIDMRLPSCMEVINSRIEKHKGKFTNYNIEFKYQDIRDDRVILSTSLDELITTKKGQDGKVYKSLEANIHTFYIPLRVTALGECNLPALTASSMYDERFNDYVKESKKIVVREIKLQKRTKMTQQEEIEQFVRRYYELEASTAPPANFMPLFHFPVRSFFGKRNPSKRGILEQIARYNRDWPDREYKITSIKIQKNIINPKKYRVEVRFKYRLKRGVKVNSGESAQYLNIGVYDSGYLIDSIGSMRR